MNAAERFDLYLAHLSEGEPGAFGPLFTTLTVLRSPLD
mgnify:CR=1 FL=1